jgi:hypothetical protein
MRSSSQCIQIRRNACDATACVDESNLELTKSGSLLGERAESLLRGRFETDLELLDSCWRRQEQVADSALLGLKVYHAF